MSAIAKLKLVASKRERFTSPTVARRQKLADKLEEQLALCTAQKNGTVYAPKRIKTVTNADGERVRVEAIKRVKEWFWTTSSGKINLAVRYGSKTLTLNSKGANCIELNTGEELISTLALLKDAVIAGELDDAIANASDKLRAGFGK